MDLRSTRGVRIHSSSRWRQALVAAALMATATVVTTQLAGAGSGTPPSDGAIQQPDPPLSDRGTDGAAPADDGLQRRSAAADRPINDQIDDLAQHSGRSRASITAQARGIVTLRAPLDIADAATLPDDVDSISVYLALPDDRPLVYTMKPGSDIAATLRSFLAETRVSSEDPHSFLQAFPGMDEDLQTEAVIVGYSAPIAAIQRSEAGHRKIGRAIEVAMTSSVQPMYELVVGGVVPMASPGESRSPATTVPPKDGAR
jgi:hypothetical protein